MKAIYILLFIAIGSCATFKKNELISSGLKTVKLYHTPVPVGLSTGGVIAYFNKVENSEYTILSSNEVDKLEGVLIRSKKKRHIQQKFGSGLFLGEFVFNKHSNIEFKVAMMVFKHSILIIDVAARIEYIITLPEDVKAIKEIMSDL
ncbi:hypothetical protein [Carboxylicivirga sp. RSCT41]|uniref:hypothetical protein n=1 Tax=Carboxylicivirga agarovorans TaxID=3417570 RepID=UPI003D34F10E